MKKIILAITTIIVCFSSFAQSNNSASSEHKIHNKNRVNQQNTNKPDLSDDQKAQLKTINENFRQQMQDLHKNTSLTADEIKEKRKTLVKEHKEKINSILTDEQRKEAESRHYEFEKGNKEEMRGERFEEMTKDLHLTPEQSEKMKNLNTALMNSIQSIRQNTALSQEEKKEQMKSLMKKHKDDMETLLTDEQKEQFKNNNKKRQNSVVG